MLPRPRGSSMDTAAAASDAVNTAWVLWITLPHDRGGPERLAPLLERLQGQPLDSSHWQLQQLMSTAPARAPAGSAPRQQLLAAAAAHEHRGRVAAAPTQLHVEMCSDQDHAAKLIARCSAPPAAGGSNRSRGKAGGRRRQRECVACVVVDLRCLLLELVRAQALREAGGGAPLPILAYSFSAMGVGEASAAALERGAEFVPGDEEAIEARLRAQLRLPALSAAPWSRLRGVVTAGVSTAGTVGGAVVSAAGTVGGAVVSTAGTVGGTVVSAAGTVGGAVVSTAGTVGGTVVSAAGTTGVSLFASRRILLSGLPRNRVTQGTH